MLLLEPLYSFECNKCSRTLKEKKTFSGYAKNTIRRSWIALCTLSFLMMKSFVVAVYNIRKLGTGVTELALNSEALRPNGLPEFGFCSRRGMLPAGIDGSDHGDLLVLLGQDHARGADQN